MEGRLLRLERSGCLPLVAQVPSHVAHDQGEPPFSQQQTSPEMLFMRSVSNSYTYLQHTTNITIPKLLQAAWSRNAIVFLDVKGGHPTASRENRRVFQTVSDLI